MCCYVGLHSGRGAVPRVEAVERARAEGRELVDLLLLACVCLWSRCARSRSLGSRLCITRRDMRCCHVSRGAGGVDCGPLDDVVKLSPIGCHWSLVGGLEELSKALMMIVDQ